MNPFTAKERAKLVILELTRRENETELLGAGPLRGFEGLPILLAGHRTANNTDITQPPRERRLVNADLLGERRRAPLVRTQHPLDHLRSKGFGIRQYLTLYLAPSGLARFSRKSKKQNAVVNALRLPQHYYWFSLCR